MTMNLGRSVLLKKFLNLVFIHDLLFDDFTNDMADGDMGFLDARGII